MWKYLGTVLSLCLFLPACVQAQSVEKTVKATTEPVVSAEPGPVLIPLKLANLTIQVELACTEQEQQKGLMFRPSLPSDQGMLFVFERELPLSFWMKDTLVPLSIAYIDAKGKIVDIQDMKPLDTTPHQAAAPAQYALEMNQDWFARHQIVAGERIELDSFCADRPR